jgi:hypothetical protein
MAGINWSAWGIVIITIGLGIAIYFQGRSLQLTGSEKGARYGKFAVFFGGAWIVLGIILLKLNLIS